MKEEVKQQQTGVARLMNNFKSLGRDQKLSTRSLANLGSFWSKFQSPCRQPRIHKCTLDHFGLWILAEISQVIAKLEQCCGCYVEDMDEEEWEEEVRAVKYVQQTRINIANQGSNLKENKHRWSSLHVIIFTIFYYIFGQKHITPVLLRFPYINPMHL